MQSRLKIFLFGDSKQEVKLIIFQFKAQQIFGPLNQIINLILSNILNNLSIIQIQIIIKPKNISRFISNLVRFLTFIFKFFIVFIVFIKVIYPVAVTRNIWCIGITFIDQAHASTCMDQILVFVLIFSRKTTFWWLPARRIRICTFDLAIVIFQCFLFIIFIYYFILSVNSSFNMTYNK